MKFASLISLLSTLVNSMEMEMDMENSTPWTSKSAMILINKTSPSVSFIDYYVKKYVDNTMPSMVQYELHGNC